VVILFCEMGDEMNDEVSDEMSNEIGWLRG
jgi:hypothetical protein